VSGEQEVGDHGVDLIGGDGMREVAPFHRMLRNAGTGDPELAEFVANDHAIRRESQHANIRFIADGSPLRLGADEAADTYSALANPDVFLLLTDQFGWTAEDYRAWLADSVTRLLLSDGS
jgi:hypothetical protein